MIEGLIEYLVNICFDCKYNSQEASDKYFGRNPLIGLTLAVHDIETTDRSSRGEMWWEIPLVALLPVGSYSRHQ